MTRSQYGPAAGASGGARPRLADMRAPDFIRWENNELHQLLHVLRDRTTVHLYLLLTSHADFRSGELVPTYARLMDLMTPPQPERGRRMPGPTLAEVRRALDWLIGVGLVLRDPVQNAAQGQLRVHVAPRDKRAAAKAPRNTTARAELRQLAQELKRDAKARPKQ